MLNLQSVYFGQRHSNFDYTDFDIIKKVSRLSHKHHRQAENNCNGEGWVKSHFYRCDGSTDGAYISEDQTIFNYEMGLIEVKIERLIANKPKFKVEYQGDPRGCTVKLYYEGDFIEL